MWDTIFIQDEENRPHPHCPDCNIFFPWTALNHHHPTTALFARVSERKIWSLVEEEAREGAELVFKAYIQALVMVSYLRYLGQTLTEIDNNCLAIIGNLQKVRQTWARLLQIQVS